MSQATHVASDENEENSWGLPPEIAFRDSIIGREDVGIVRLETDGWSCHRHSHVQLLLSDQINAGQIKWCAPSDSVLCDQQLNARHVLFIAAEVQHTVSLNRTAEILVILVRTHFLQRVLAEERWAGVVLAEFAALVAKDRLIWWLTSVCIHLCRKGDALEHPLIEQVGRSLARRLLVAQFGRCSIADPNDTVLTPAQLKKLTDHIEADWKRVWSVAELAKLVGLSREHFSRVFKNAVGVSPARYQKICRMQKAQEMLRSGNHRIEEVAFALGFKDASYFSRCFRAVFGIPPSEYMKEHRGKVC